MTYTKKQFLEDVAAEATALKEHATKEELAKLNLKEFDPHSPEKCIYGLIGEDCRSDRSIELINKCCVRFFDGEALWQIAEVTKKRNALLVALEHAKDAERTVSKSFFYVSAIETYIYLPNAKNANLIAFLKGERKDLVL